MRGRSKKATARRGLLQRAQTYGLTAGVMGGKRNWLIVGISAWGIRKAKSLGSRETRVLLAEPLKPGERIEITHTGVTRAQDRKARKAAERAGVGAGVDG